jgi:fermentation-respiration switch protein FrsA (DUF1100 family)
MRLTSRGRDAASRPLRIIGRIACAAALGYLIIVATMMLLENALIFPAPPRTSGDWDGAEFAAEDAHFQADDGVQLHGWYVEHPEPRAYVLFCHGNAEHVGYLGELLAELRDEFGASALAFDYRGYGRSQGRPNEQGVLADGRAAQAWLAQRAGVRQNEIVLMGRSLGGAVAVDLAARNGARGLVLENTFTTLPDLAAHHYPWLPVRWLMRSRFDSLSKIASYDGPLLMTHGVADEVAPYDLGRRLFEAAPGRHKRFVPIPGARHNDPRSPQFHAALHEFLASLPPMANR